MCPQPGVEPGADATSSLSSSLIYSVLITLIWYMQRTWDLSYRASPKLQGLLLLLIILIFTNPYSMEHTVASKEVMSWRENYLPQGGGVKFNWIN